MTLPVDGPCTEVATNRLAQPILLLCAPRKAVYMFIPDWPLALCPATGCPEPEWQGAGLGPKPDCMLHGHGGG